MNNNYNSWTSKIHPAIKLISLLVGITAWISIFCYMANLPIPTTILTIFMQFFVMVFTMISMVIMIKSCFRIIVEEF